MKKDTVPIKKRIVPALGLSVFLLVASAFFVGKNLGKEGPDISEAQQRQYPFLATRLFGAQNNDMIVNFTQLREVMKERYTSRNLPAGVYFEYLPTGASIGVNDQLEVKIGSLSKVPAVMAVFNQLEKGALNMDTELTIEQDNLDSNFGDLWKKGAGTKLTINEAVALTLKKSDNTAAGILLKALPSGALTDVFDQLDLPKTRTGPFPVMSPKSYASVFRSLYLATYLSRDNSNLILQELSQTDFKDKLPAGVDPSVKVSHKIGVYQVGDKENVYGDCGVVYVPLRPYMLCVMIAAEEAVAREEIVAYSKMVYSFVSQVKPTKKASTE